MRRSKALRRARIREDMGLDQSPAKLRWYERNWFKAIELAAIVIGVGAITYEVWQREAVDRPLAEATLRELRQSEVDRLFAVIEDQSALAESRWLAVERLAILGEALNFLNLGCTSTLDAALIGLPAETDLASSVNCSLGNAVRLNVIYDDPMQSVGTRFKWVTFVDSGINGLVCKSCDFRGVAMLSGEVENTSFVETDLTGSIFSARVFANNSFVQSNLSNASFSPNALDDLSASDVLGSWYWSDQPPRRISRDGSVVFTGTIGIGDAVQNDFGDMELFSSARDRMTAGFEALSPADLAELELMACPAERRPNTTSIVTQCPRDWEGLIDELLTPLHADEQ